ncbi:hypothetical protein [Soonwooa sp.]|uniref:SecDF P1 head subdomain-containing protein n=1 Tax=Soonwooa sp. TaxID=1938592 RepID=UPI00260315D8|nr:hypothetical protein [Soonwooa sp.]
MKLNKTYFLFLILLLIFTNVQAQFVGLYNLHDGGVDTPNSQLIVRANHDFILVYFGGVKKGTWKEVDANSIQLTETKPNAGPILLYGKTNKNNNGIAVDVYGIHDAEAFIQFAKDTLRSKDLQPVFNPFPNCIGNNYVIKRANKDDKWLTISIPTNPSFKSMKTKYPYKALSYTFALNNKFNSYQIFFNPENIFPEMSLSLVKKAKTYQLSYFEKSLEREEITPELEKAIQRNLVQLEQYELRRNLGTPIPSTYDKKLIVYSKPKLKPLFTANCEGEKDDNDKDDLTEKKEILPKVDRPNGFYTVTNFNEADYDPKKFNLAKTPSLTTSDISSVYKVVADLGGYEIEIKLTPAGATKFAELTRNNVNKPVAIVIDKEIISEPYIQSEIPGGLLRIAGDFSDEKLNSIISKLENK